MDNCIERTRFDVDDNGEILAELPREEALVRFYGLRDRYGSLALALFANTPSGQHAREHGHALTYGCCRDHCEAA